MTDLTFPAWMTPVVSRPQGIGKVFYVHHFAGNNNNNGVDPSTPFATITYALAQCVDDRNDYIIVLDCWNAEPAFPVVVSVAKVHIIGVSLPTANAWAQLAGGGNNIFEITAASRDSEIAGFGFTSAGAAGIACSAAAMNIWIHHCTFAQAGVALQDGILGIGAIDTLPHGLVENCYFGSGITRDGIAGNLTNCTIRNNIFRDCAAVSIDHGGVEVGAIIQNYFFYAIAGAPAAGWAITLNVGANGGIIAHNFASQTGDDMGNNPYRDLSTGVLATCLNGWVANYAGNALSPGPAVV